VVLVGSLKAAVVVVVEAVETKIIEKLKSKLQKAPT
jgi:hypothetical protein